MFLAILEVKTRYIQVFEGHSTILSKNEVSLANLVASFVRQPSDRIKKWINNTFCLPHVFHQKSHKVTSEMKVHQKWRFGSWYIGIESYFWRFWGQLRPIVLPSMSSSWSSNNMLYGGPLRIVNLYFENISACPGAGKKGGGRGAHNFLIPSPMIKMSKIGRV